MNRRLVWLFLVACILLLIFAWLFLRNRDESPGQEPPPQAQEQTQNETLTTEQSHSLDTIRSQAPAASPRIQEQSRQLDQLRQTQE